MKSDQEEVLFKLLKETMGYTHATDTCQNCVHFRECDQGGGPRALPAHCTYNRSVAVPVELGGRCNFFDKKPTASK
jgi:hypothetical protein